MPALGNISAYDAESTPVLHTFVPRAAHPVATFSEGAANPAGRPTLTYRRREGDNGKFYYRVALTVPYHVIETTNGVERTAISHVELMDLSVRFSNVASTQERANVIEQFANLLLSGGIRDALVNDEMFW